MMKKVLVTGAAGFVGRHLVSRLLDEDEYTIIGTYRNCRPALEKITWYDTDLTDSSSTFSLINHERPDVIIHLAAVSSVAQSWLHPSKVILSNAQMTLNILEAVRCSKLNARTLIIGSSEEYGNVSSMDLPIKENHELSPINPYGVSKMNQYHIARLYWNAYNLDILFTRSFNHTGPGQNVNFVVPQLCRNALKFANGMIDTVLAGNLEIRRDITDVRDMVEAYVDLVDRGRSGEVYNVGSGRSIQLKEILKIIENRLNTKIRYEQDKSKYRKNDVTDIYADITKIRTDIGWIPRLSFRKTIEDILDHLLSEQ